MLQLGDGSGEGRAPRIAGAGIVEGRLHRRVLAAIGGRERDRRDDRIPARIGIEAGANGGSTGVAGHVSLPGSW